MRISNNIQTIHPKSASFTSTLKISPHPSKWNQKILNSVINSETIADMIKENEKIGKDIELRYYRKTSPHYPEIPAPDDIYLTVKGGKGDIFLSSHSTYKFIPGSFFENVQERDVYHGPRDVVKDLSDQIKEMDYYETPTDGKKTLADLTKLVSKVVYEPEVKVDPYG